MFFFLLGLLESVNHSNYKTVRFEEAHLIFLTVFWDRGQQTMLCWEEIEPTACFLNKGLSECGPAHLFALSLAAFVVMLQKLSS